MYIGQPASTKQGTSSIAFLFDANYPPFNGWYGEPSDTAVLKAVFAEDKQGACVSQMARGDLMFWMIAQRYNSVASEKDLLGRTTLKSETGYDTERYSAILWDFVDSVSVGWHTTQDEEFPLYLLQGNLHVVYLPTIPTEFVKAIDKRLKKFPAYIGAMEVDLGNPIHVRVFPNGLVNDNFIRENKIYCTKELAGYQMNIISDSPSIKKRVCLLFEDDFAQQIPEHPPIKPLSKRGRVTAELLIETQKESHYQKLAESLSFMKSKPGDKEFKFNIPEGFEKFLIPKDKLVKYVLNLEHPEGGPKAILFKEVLNITSKDWAYLKSSIENALPKASIHKTRVTDYGIQYHALIPITGLNGKKRKILTAWIVIGDLPARLSTAYIATKKDEQRYK